MISFDLAYELTLGSAWAFSDYKSGNRLGLSRGLMFSALFHIPTCVTGFIAWPSWQIMQAFDLPSSPFHSGLLGGLSILLLFLGFLTGFKLAQALLKISFGFQTLAALLLLAWVFALGAMWLSPLPVFGEKDRTLFLLVTGALNLFGFAYLYFKTFTFKPDRK